MLLIDQHPVKLNPRCLIATKKGHTTSWFVEVKKKKKKKKKKKWSLGAKAGS